LRLFSISKVWSPNAYVENPTVYDTTNPWNSFPEGNIILEEVY